MKIDSGMPEFGLNALAQQFREALAAFAPPSHGAMPGWNPWPGTSGWPGMLAGMGAMPGMSAAPMPGGPAGSFAGQLGTGPFANLFEQLSTLAQGQWQQLAARFVGGAMPAQEMFPDWREALGEMWPTGAGPTGIPGMNEAALRETLSTPQVGPLREHIERWQQAMLAQLDYQAAARAFSARLGEIMQRALELYRQRLAARGDADQPVTSLRELFDEWIEAGEEAWAEHASSDEFIAALGAYSNAQMQVRAARADAVNRMAQSLGLPTREEVDADHRRIAQLEREVRRLRREREDARGVSAMPEASPAAATTTSRAADPGARRAKAGTPPGNSATRATKAKPVAKQARASSTKPATATRKPAAPKSATAKSGAAMKSTRPATPARTGSRSPASAFAQVAAPRAIGKTARKRSTK